MHTSNRHLLVFAPHSDDAEFGLGAHLVKAIEERAKVTVVIAAHGDYRRGIEVIEGREREEESRMALGWLGVTRIDFARWFEENQALTVDYGTLVGEIESQVNGYQPTEVYIPLPSFNQDHRVLYDAAITAFRPGNLKPSLYAYEYPGNAWGPPPPATGHRYLPCSKEHLERKIQALRMHASQFQNRYVAVGPEAARNLAIKRGDEVGELTPAELVYVLREIVR